MDHLLAVAPLYNPAINRNVGGVCAGGNTICIIQLYLRNFIYLAFGVAGVWAFYNLIRGGYEYIMAGGDKESIEKARKRLMNALVGLGLVFSVYMFIYLAEVLFGITILEFNVPTV